MVKNTKRSGFALITALLIVVVVFLMVGTMVSRLRMGAVFGRESTDDIKALYAAEAGVQRVLAEWSADDGKTWAQDLVKIPLKQTASSSYTVRFANTASVNNFNGLAATSGPLGAGTVPAGMAYVVVDGESNGRIHRVEVMVSRGSFFSEPVALASDSNINLANDVSILGLKSFSERVVSDAEVFTTSDLTNRQNGGQPTVNYSGSGTLKIRGNLSTNSGDVNSVANAYRAPGVVTGQIQSTSSKKMPVQVDIQSKIDTVRNSNPLTVSLGTGTTVLAPQGTKKDYYQSGPLSYNGDLELNGANLYVEGDLNVNGAIRGKGSVFVKGTTTLKGDSQIQASDDQGLALFSKGDVSLTGFDGSAYLKNHLTSLGVDPLSTAQDGGTPVQYVDHLDTLTQLTDRMQDCMVHQGISSQPTAGDPTNVLNVGVGTNKRFGSVLSPFSYSEFDSYYANLVVSNIGTSEFQVNATPLTFQPGHSKAGQQAPSLHVSVGHSDVIHKLTATVANPANSQEQFLFDRLNKLYEWNPAPNSLRVKGLFGAKVGGHQTEATLRKIMSSGTADEFIDTINDLYRDPNSIYGTAPAYFNANRSALMARTLNAMEQNSFDKLGTSFFEGVIYTDGSFTAGNDLRILGSLLAKGNVNLQNGVTIVQIPELIRRTGQSLGTVVVQQWIRR